MPTARLIKRYANRKMYDTQQSCYVTLEEVAELVREGEDVRVIDNRTKEDLTQVTLTHALLDSERKNRGNVSLSSIKVLIAQGGDFLQKKIGEPVTRARTDAERTVKTWRDEAERRAEYVLKRKAREAETEGGVAGAAGVDGDATQAEVDAQSAATSGDARPDAGPVRHPSGVAAFVEQTQRAYDELHHTIDERVRAVVAALAPASLEAEVARLHERLDALETRLAQLGPRTGAEASAEAGTEAGTEAGED